MSGFHFRFATSKISCMSAASTSAMNRFWWNRSGPMFAAEIRNNRVGQMRVLSHWPWHLDDGASLSGMLHERVFTKINGQTHCLRRAVDHEGEVLESYVSKRRSRIASLKFLGKSIKRCGNAPRQETGRWLNNRAENSHLPFRRRGPAPLAVCRQSTVRQRMRRFRQMRSLQKFVAVHASVQNHFNQERHLYAGTAFNLNRAAVLAEWRQLGVA
jgi:putative transposase